MKYIYSFLLTMLLVTPVFTPLASASSADIPEAAGDYPEPGNNHIRVRVFVHQQKISSTPLLACVDPDSQSVDAATGWKLPSTLTYRLNPSSVPTSVGTNNLAIFANTAFQTWSTATSGKVTFNRGQDTRTNKQSYDGQNIVAWGRTSGQALAVTYTRYNTTTNQVVDVDTIMNSKYKWAWDNLSCGDPNYYDAQDILTHELGHWMGLADHYTNDYIDNTMYGYGDRGEVKKNTLTTGDTLGIHQIYQ